MYFEQCLQEVKKQYDQWLMLDAKERSVMELSINTLRSGFSRVVEKILSLA